MREAYDNGSSSCCVAILGSDCRDCVVRMIEAISTIGAAFGLVCALTGAAVWLRWGWTGVAFIFRYRKEVDGVVEKEIELERIGGQVG